VTLKDPIPLGLPLDGDDPSRVPHAEKDASLFGRDDVLRVLHGFNPWWSGRTISLPAFRRCVYHACRRHLESRSAQFVLLLSGLRGCGKTTVLLQLAGDLVAAGREPRSVLYLGLSHPVLSRVPLSDVLALYREMVHPKDKPAILLLDAMHCAREWDREIKQLLQDSSGYRIIATESVAMIERALVTETQLGRWRATSAPSLSFYEYLALRGLDPMGVPSELHPDRTSPIQLPLLRKAQQALRPHAAHFRRYLTGGGLPWIAAMGDAGPSSVTYEDLAEAILRRDVSQHFGPRNVEDLKRLFVYVCMHTGDVFPAQRYAKLVDASTSTVAAHVELLERCFLLRRLPPVGRKGEIVQKARHRVFAADTTLRNAQLLRDADHLSDSEDMRRVIDTCVVRHVVERHAASLAHVGYWRDARTRRSVDVVVREPGGTVVFQAMHRRGPASPDRDGVIEFCKMERACRAFLVTREEDEVAHFKLQGEPTEYYQLPAHLLAYLLGRDECAVAKT
jgi:predicted AAA+ superfamily ATPase